MEDKKKKACTVEKTSDGGLFVICTECKGENLFSPQRVSLAKKRPLRCWKCGAVLPVDPTNP